MPERIRLTHLDGKLPNLALMKLSHWHKARGDDVYLTRSVQPDLFEGRPDKVYASAIFEWSLPRVQELLNAFPGAILGGTGSGRPLDESVEDVIGEANYEHYDYSIYPEYPWSLGFTQRGCRLRCRFCVVPGKEGLPLAVNTIADIWREGTPRNVVLLDNDFFGQGRAQWRARLQELRDGDFKVSFNQSDERVFFRGVRRLEQAGIPPQHLMVYMLVGFAENETTADVFYRYQRLVDAGCKPFPMVFDRTRKDLLDFQRWVVGRYHEFVRWCDYNQPVPDIPAAQEVMALQL